MPAKLQTIDRLSNKKLQYRILFFFINSFEIFKASFEYDQIWLCTQMLKSLLSPTRNQSQEKHECNNTLQPVG